MKDIHKKSKCDQLRLSQIPFSSASLRVGFRKVKPWGSNHKTQMRMKTIFVDFDLALLKHLVRIIDQHLVIMYQEAAREDDLDSFGYYDNAEHITGLGFVACQTYMSSVCGYYRIKKRKALSVGPIHSSGQTKVQIINDAANYWKHNSEWSFEKSDTQRRRIEKTFESIGFSVDADYPLCGVLAEIVSPEKAAFKPIIPVLESWRDELRKKRPTPAPPKKSGQAAGDARATE